MSIRQIQIARTVEKIVRYYLNHGRYPTFKTITNHFGQWLQEQTPGVPSYSPLRVFRKQKSSARDYNENVRLIHQDVSDAYEATIDQTVRIMTNFNFIETERQKLWHQLTDTSKKIDKLLLVSDNGYGYVDTVMEYFNDLSGTNKEKSTVFVNVKSQEVTLKENQRSTKKVLLAGSSAQFNVLSSNEKHAALESINNAFDDSNNTAWWQVVKTKAPGTIKAELVIMFSGEEDINEVEYVAHHVKPSLIQIEYTTDGSSYYSIPGKNNKRQVVDVSTWSFPQIKAKGIKLIFEKKEHDDQSNGLYQYYFGAKNISVYKKNYLSEGALYTNPLKFNSSNINQVSLQVKHEVPYNTSINYEVALAEGNKNVSDLIWYPISPLDDTQPKYAKTVEFQLRKNKNIEFGQAGPSGEVKNGMQVFRLIKDDNDPTVPDSFDNMIEPKLLRGINQWRRERTYVAFDGSVPLNNKWKDQYDNRPQNILVDYLPIGNTLYLNRVGAGLQDNFYRFTTCIYTEESKTVPLSLAVIQTVDGVRKKLGAFSVYVNQKRMVPSNEEVTMTLNSGWNEIQLLFHWGDMQLRKDFPKEQLPNETYVGKFNFAAEARVRADLEPLKCIDVHSLYHNISPNNHDYFAIYERQVVLNYLPKNCILQLSYDVKSDGKEKNEIVIRASMKRTSDATYITPKIFSLQARAK